MTDSFPLYGVCFTTEWWKLTSSQIIDQANELKALGGKVTRIETPAGGLFTYSKLQFLLITLEDRDIKAFFGTAASGFAIMAAKQFPETIVGVEIGNEPNNPTFFSGTAVDYVSGLKYQYARIKKFVPTLLVVGGSIALVDIPYIKELVAAGINDYIDCFSIHPYSVDTATGEWLAPDVSLSKLPEVWELIRKPLWITEFGYPVSLPQQHEWLSQAGEIISRTPHVELATLYSLDGPFRVGNQQWTNT
jgi:hypothetical protein